MQPTDQYPVDTPLCRVECRPTSSPSRGGKHAPASSQKGTFLPSRVMPASSKKGKQIPTSNQSQGKAGGQGSQQSERVLTSAVASSPVVKHKLPGESCRPTYSQEGSRNPPIHSQVVGHKLASQGKNHRPTSSRGGCRNPPSQLKAKPASSQVESHTRRNPLSSQSQIIVGHSQRQGGKGKPISSSVEHKAASSQCPENDRASSQSKPSTQAVQFGHQHASSQRQEVEHKPSSNQGSRPKPPSSQRQGAKSSPSASFVQHKPASRSGRGGKHKPGSGQEVKHELASDQGMKPDQGMKRESASHQGVKHKPASGQGGKHWSSLSRRQEDTTARQSGIETQATAHCKSVGY